MQQQKTPPGNKNKQELDSENIKAPMNAIYKLKIIIFLILFNI